MPATPSRILITGASGFLGTALTKLLREAGYRVDALGRRPPAPGSTDLQWDPEHGKLDAAALEGVDAVVHLAGENVADKRWTPEQKERIGTSRTRPTTLLAETLARLQRPPRVLLSGSAVGYYGNRGDEVLREESAPGTDFLGNGCREWEAAAAPAAAAGIRVAFLRTGVVLDPSGGPLAKMLVPFRMGVGGVFGSGKQWMSWIALPDWLRAVRFLLDEDGASGPFNLTAPKPVTNAELTHTLGRVLHRPTVLPVPAFGLKLLLGEMAEALFLGGQRVLPARLEAAGFRFEHPELEPALRSLLERDTLGS